MWTIGQLKMRGKAAFKKNYWRAVLIALIISIIGGTQGTNISDGIFSGAVQGITRAIGGTAEKSTSDKSSSDRSSSDHKHEERHHPDDGMDDFDYYYDEDFFGDDFFDEFDYEFDYDDDYGYYDYDTFGGVIEDDDSTLGGVLAALLVGFFAIVVAIAIVLGILAIVLRIFLFNPIEVGCTRFFVSNLTQSGRIGEAGFAFDHHYKNHVYIMFLRSLFTFLWSLLCVIPGIIKGYEYRMIPYLLAEYPDLSKDRAFAISKQMMYGYKMKAFLLDLSFIGWWILNIFTCGILGVLYVAPYYHSTAAAFYEAIKGYNGIPGIMPPMWNTQQTQTGAWNQPNAGAQTGAWNQPNAGAQTGAWNQPNAGAQTGAWNQPNTGAQTGAWNQPNAGAQTGTWDQTSTEPAPAESTPQAAGTDPAPAESTSAASDEPVWHAMYPEKEQSAAEAPATDTIPAAEASEVSAADTAPAAEALSTDVIPDAAPAAEAPATDPAPAVEAPSSDTTPTEEI